MRARAEQPAPSFTAPVISSRNSQSCSGFLQPKNSAAGALRAPLFSSSQKPLKGAMPAPEPTMMMGMSFSGNRRAEDRCLAKTTSPAFSLAVSHREHMPKKRLRLLGRAASAGRQPAALSCCTTGPESGISWLVRLTQRVMRSGVAFGEEAMVNSLAFCLGQCKRKSLMLMPPADTPNKLQNSDILRQSAEACSNFRASASARSLATRSCAEGSFSLGCKAVSIFLVGARPRSQ
mmetsp:Transcript_83492/g.249058  ORF Transcript_83492/g.249058 Transcript_83492/m.249058 type:complete len:234 (+) Transcript_83492:402-1103(+)